MQLRGLLSHLSLIAAVAALSFQCIAAGPGEIGDTCKSIAGKHPDIKKIFCQAALVAASKTINSSTDPNELAGAVTKIAAANAAATMDTIEELKEHETSEDAKKRLDECIKIYDEAIGHMKDADSEISKHEFEKAIALLKLSLDGGEKCQKAFDDSHHVSPTRAVDENYSRLANIAVELLLGSK